MNHWARGNLKNALTALELIVYYAFEKGFLKLKSASFFFTP